ncbi:hypothetical protein AB0E55_08465, partial [Amycolatopsis keratiniphila]|uniref:hypothetical protein n=1 Tax=Amycolatopsis keratiniphila TaxID=129921 RepID=UPI0033FCBA3C
MFDDFGTIKSSFVVQLARDHRASPPNHGGGCPTPAGSAGTTYVMKGSFRTFSVLNDPFMTSARASDGVQDHLERRLGRPEQLHVRP